MELVIKSSWSHTEVEQTNLDLKHYEEILEKTKKDTELAQKWCIGFLEVLRSSQSQELIKKFVGWVSDIRFFGKMAKYREPDFIKEHFVGKQKKSKKNNTESPEKVNFQKFLRYISVCYLIRRKEILMNDSGDANLETILEISCD